MPITGIPGRPTTQGKNGRSHQTLQRFLKANRPHNLSALRKLIQRYREHYNRRRPHRALHQSTPEMAWQTLEHTPATEPLHLSVLQAKAAHYLQHRRPPWLNLPLMATNTSWFRTVAPQVESRRRCCRFGADWLLANVQHRLHQSCRSLCAIPVSVTRARQSRPRVPGRLPTLRGVYRGPTCRGSQAR